MNAHRAHRMAAEIHAARTQPAWPVSNHGHPVTRQHSADYAAGYAAGWAAAKCDEWGDR